MSSTLQTMVRYLLISIVCAPSVSVFAAEQDDEKEIQRLIKSMQDSERAQFLGESEAPEPSQEYTDLLAPVSDQNEVDEISSEPVSRQEIETEATKAETNVESVTGVLTKDSVDTVTGKSNDNSRYALPEKPEEIQQDSQIADADATSSDEEEVVEELPIDKIPMLEIEDVVDMGLTSLALELLNDKQLEVDLYSARWYAFEYKRIKLLSQLSRWQDLIARIDNLMSATSGGERITNSVKQWFITQKVIAELKINRPENALMVLRKLIWQSPPIDNQASKTGQALLPLWRRLVIRAYLLQERNEDARRSLIKYEVDFQDNDEEWKMLQARVLMHVKQYDAVIKILEGSVDQGAQPLRWLATIREQPQKLHSLVKYIRGQLKDAELDKEQRWAYQYVVYMANRQTNNLPAATIELETLLAYGDVDSILGEEHRADGDDLWRLYQQLGESIANKEKLLKGDYVAWFKLAKKLKKTSLVSSRSLYAVIALSSNDIEQRQSAHKNLIQLLIGRRSYVKLFEQLYLRASHVENLKDIDSGMRYKLIDHALKVRNIQLAAAMMKSLDRAPEGQDDFEWEMRKARVLILKGDYRGGAQALKDSLLSFDDLPKEKMDQFLQVVFDFQTAKQHRIALEMFDLLESRPLPERYQRELAFWRADSYFDMGDYPRAAIFYLHSARLVDPTMSDNWGTSARFNAAKALTKEKLFEDAVRIYKSLLVGEDDSKRRVTIRQKLQRIQILRNAEEEIEPSL